MTGFSPWRFSVAPMMDWTDRHCRFFHRLFTRHARLYTEMVTTGAVLHANRERLLGYNPSEHPLALQLGGSDPTDLARCARIGADLGYAEINLNCGCPSDRVQDGRFGACLMREPLHVGECIAAMKAAIRIPVTVKCRIGVDDQDPGEALDAFADAVVQAGADALIVHARKAWLQGLSPKENRDIPPLDYGRVFALKKRLGAFPVVLNGGIASVAAGAALLEPREGLSLDGVMLGRAAYQNPGDLLNVDPLIFGEPAPIGDEFEAVEQMRPYLAFNLAKGTRMAAMTRHMLGLFHGRPGARAWRRLLTEGAIKPQAKLDLLDAALRGLAPVPQTRMAAE